MRYTIMPSPVGELLAAGDEQGLRRLAFMGGGEPERLEADWYRDDGFFPGLREELEAYFRGELRHFSVPVAGCGSPFQRRVWAALCEIPYGRVASYGEIARRIGSPNAVRAVGAANGANPIAIIVPCHRVIGSNGRLTGYAGGLAIKARLLRLEGIEVDARTRVSAGGSLALPLG